MNTHRIALKFACIVVACAPASISRAELRSRVVMVAGDQVTTERLEGFRRQGYDGVAIPLTAGSGAERQSQLNAAQSVLRSGLALHYWMEIGRCPELAEEHPLWMASLQGHQEWRRFFPKLRRPSDDEIVKTYPWVPILYRESYDAHLGRVTRLLDGAPQAATVYLNDLQGAPSACGCGHPLCRWTSDYGPLRTATKLDDDAAAQFLAAVKKLVPQSSVVPVLATECEEHDREGLCGGVGCFEGICWRAFSKLLKPLAASSDEIGVLALYRLFERDQPVFGTEAGWVRLSLESLQSMPPKRGGTPVATSRLIAILQGWNVTDEQLRAQIEQATASGARGIVVLLEPIDQSWEPRVIKRGP